MRALLPVLTLVAACSGGAAQSFDATPPPDAVDAAPGAPPLPAGLLVASRGSGVVLRYDGAGLATGTAAFDPRLVRPVGLGFGAAGELYVAAGDTDRIMRFDGASASVFTSGNLISPRNLTLGPDGALYVADGMLDQIWRYEANGEGRVFVQNASLRGPTGFTFGPDGNLYAVSVLTDRVLRFDGASGALLGQFVNVGLMQPHDVAFGPDGDLYVTNAGNGKIQRYAGATGALVGTFVDDGLRQPLGMAWGPDGNLYVADMGNDQIVRYDGATGARLGVFVHRGAGGLSSPAFLVFEPAARLSLASSPTGLVISGARPGARVLVVRGAAGGEGVIADCPELKLPVGDPVVAGVRMADESGWSVIAADGAGPFVAVDAGRCTVSDQVASR